MNFKYNTGQLSFLYACRHPGG